MRLLVLALAVVASVAACSHNTPSSPAKPAPPAADGIAPQLFSVEQLRAGNPQGRIIEIRMEADGQPTTIEHWELSTVTADAATIHSITRDEAGTVLADETGTSTWEDLHKHGQFPAAATTIEDNVALTVPAGSFKTRLYTVKDGDTTRRIWFAADLPGPPVQFTTEQAGKTVQRAQMLRAR